MEESGGGEWRRLRRAGRGGRERGGDEESER